ncbi:3-deoxy-D-manno-octulosonic acid transferase [Tenacibaculum sp. UWU-22]|uniref:3-deoxy-D-manno-octulosonic acid transferase n=1 Tax=Tenacibaculum sp. UWU-22 TaxID=3234187 RepID=UPI0034DAD523
MGFINFIYNIVVSIAYFFLQIIALFNSKIKLFINGRKETLNNLSSIKKEDKTVWFHAASLGEFEQGKPLIEAINKTHPNYKIVVTFFSPSGYEIQKNYPLANVVCYLPFDRKKNVRKFIQQLHPTLAVIIKYEFWPNLLSELKKNNTKTILVSGIFRKNQVFFKWYGTWMQKYLKTFDHFFVQNTESKTLLNQYNYQNVTVSGDTRFDRVYQILQQNNTLHFIADFIDKKYTLVAGSTWPEDDELFVNYINNKATKNEKFIIAPHNIKQKYITDLREKLNTKTILYSEKNNVDLKDYQVFIVDTIGILTKIYAYANTAYVGGGFKTELHNILEPATFGIPVVFGGNKFQKFQEAIDLLKLKGCFRITNQQEFSEVLTKLKNNTNFRIETGRINKNYIETHIGATDLILKYISKNLY